MPLRNLFNQWQHHSFIPPQLKWLYVSSLLQNMGNSLLFLVAPVFIYQLGSETVGRALFEQWLPSLDITAQQSGLLLVAFFYGLVRLSHLLLLPLVSRILPRISLNVAMILGMASYFLSSILLPMIPQNTWLLLVVPVVRSLIFHFYWTPYYILLASEIDLKKARKEVGGFEILSKIATLLGPLIGTLLTVGLGFAGAFWVGATFYFLAMFSLFCLSPMQIRTRWQWSDWLAAIKTKLGRQQFLGLAGWHWEGIGAAIMWPIFLYIFFDNLIEVGYLITGATMLSMMIIYLTGWIFDKSHKQKRWSLSSGSFLTGLWFLRLTALQLPFLVVVVEILDKIFSGMYQTFFSSLLVLRARANNAVVYSFNRQATFSIISIAGWLVLCLLILTTPTVWLIFTTFLLAMIGSMSYVQNDKLRYRR